MNKRLLPFAILGSILGITLSTNGLADSVTKPQYPTQAKRIILFIWDGLRPDSISLKHTPHLYQLKQKGSEFLDNHSSYPTFTMMNASSFATGDFAGKTGFYGNTLWAPYASGNDASDKPVDFNVPVFTEDYKILQDINDTKDHEPLIFVGTLFQSAHHAGVNTAAVGKSGPVFFQDYQQKDIHSIVLDEKHTFPLAFAKLLQSDHYSIPKLSVNAFPKGALTLSKDNGDPTAFGEVATINSVFHHPDHVTPDPSATDKTPYTNSNRYLMETYLDKVLPTEKPILSVVWLRNPDTTEHNYGVGSPSYYTALHEQDRLLGKLLDKLKALNMLENTDLIIASDHGHSNVSGNLVDFPLRKISRGEIQSIDAKGYSVSGDIRPADLLTRAGFTAFDGMGCLYDPVLSGIKSNKHFAYPIKVDTTGAICGNDITIADSNGHREFKQKKLYSTPSYKIPAKLPNDAIIVAGNGGSTYLYIPRHNPDVIKRVVHFLQSREEFDVVFTDDRYGNIPGAFPMSLVHILNRRGRNPDIIVGSNYNANAVISGIKGTEFNSGGIDRGMHGSFSSRDVHNTLIAFGPDFKTQFKDHLPSGNVDVAPTIAYLLHLPLPNTNGRALLESLKKGLPINSYQLLTVNYKPSTSADKIVYQKATNPDGKDIDGSVSKYSASLHTKQLVLHGQNYTYFDWAKAARY